jgi:hypothetical protein
LDGADKRNNQPIWSLSRRVATVRFVAELGMMLGVRLWPIRSHGYGDVVVK